MVAAFPVLANGLLSDTNVACFKLENSQESIGVIHALQLNAWRLLFQSRIKSCKESTFKTLFASAGPTRIFVLKRYKGGLP